MTPIFLCFLRVVFSPPRPFILSLRSRFYSLSLLLSLLILCRRHHPLSHVIPCKLYLLCLCVCLSPVSHSTICYVTCIPCHYQQHYSAFPAIDREQHRARDSFTLHYVWVSLMQSLVWSQLHYS